MFGAHKFRSPEHLCPAALWPAQVNCTAISMAWDREAIGFPPSFSGFTPGYLLAISHSYGKKTSCFFAGKLSIIWQFSIPILNSQRVSIRNGGLKWQTKSDVIVAGKMTNSTPIRCHCCSPMVRDQNSKLLLIQLLIFSGLGHFAAQHIIIPMLWQVIFSSNDFHMVMNNPNLFK